MTKASDNAFPSILIEEATEPSAPAAGHQRLYIDSTTHHLMRTNSSGTEVDLETGGGGGGGSGTGAILYDYTVSGADKASIDTFVDDGGGGAGAALSGSFKLMIVHLTSRTDEAVTNSIINVTLNNDSGSNYDRQTHYGNNATSGAAVALAAAQWQFSTKGASATANWFGGLEIKIHNYAGTVAFKIAHAGNSYLDPTAASGERDDSGLNYRSTSAITRLAVTPNTAAKKFIIGTRLTIFGL